MSFKLIPSTKKYKGQESLGYSLSLFLSTCVPVYVQEEEEEEEAIHCEIVCMSVWGWRRREEEKFFFLFASLMRSFLHLPGMRKHVKA